MKKRRTWQSRLTKAEPKHLKKDAFGPGGRITLADLKDMFEYQAKKRVGEDGYEPCWICKGIAGKLGFEV